VYYFTLIVGIATLLISAMSCRTSKLAAQFDFRWVIAVARCSSAAAARRVVRRKRRRS